MAHYTFCAWMPAGQPGKSIADVSTKRTDEWTAEREAKGKEGFTLVIYQPEPIKKIKPKGNDSIYILGHHNKNVDFISDFRKKEVIQRNYRNETITVQATLIRPEEFVNRFHHCFHSSKSFTGKIKFYNCYSGHNGGASFAKIAADRMRALWPNAVYIGYRDAMSQCYGDVVVDDEFTQLVKLLEGVQSTVGRAKFGVTSKLRAKGLQVIL